MTDLPDVLSSPRLFRWLAVIVACLLVTGVSSVGQIESRLDAADVAAGGYPTTTLPAGGLDQTTTPTSGLDPATTVATAPGSAPPASVLGSDGRPVTPTTAGRVATPDFGLKTQGVTAKEVKVGITYNVSACGDAGTLSAAAGAAVTGDMKNAITAFTRHVNDTGGVGGRTLKVVVADDGGGGCSEKALAAARQLVDDEKVFAVIPGLHTVADYVASKKVPTFIGRDDPASLARYGPNGIGLVQEMEGNLNAWAAFGRHYLDAGKHKPCLVHPEPGDSGDWTTAEHLLVKKMAAQGLSFTDIVVYKEDVASAQQQATAASVRMKTKGCDQVWFMAGNPIALIFFTQAASQNAWFPTWTFTSYMVLADSELGGRLMDQQQWEHAVGLSSRVPPGQHPKEGNCKRIYERYYPGDGQSESAATQLACAAILSAAETMRRGIARTGVLTASSLLVGADAIDGNWYYDAHVPLDWRFPSPAGPFKTKAWSHYTVVDWNSSTSKYDFPAYPTYWEVMGPGRSGGKDLRPVFRQTS